MSSTATAAVAPRAASPFILSPLRDLVLFVVTPALVLPAFWLARQAASVEQIALWVASFGALGHHLPGMLRAYGDRALFRRFRTRFLVAPLVLAAACVFANVKGFGSLALLVYLWGVWHGMMQTFGFVRIYGARGGGESPWASRLDFALCASFFYGAVVLSDTRLPHVLKLLSEAGAPLLPPAAVAGLRVVAKGAIAVAALLWLLDLARGLAAGRRPAPLRLLTVATSLGFWWYTNASLADMLVGIALFEVFHDVQYLTIVWMFNRNRAKQAPGELASWLRFLFGRSGALAGVYVGLVFAYGGLNFGARAVGEETLRAALLGVLAASALLHFYFDSFIWKVRDSETRRGLGLAEAGPAARPATAFSFGLGHAARWVAVALPFVLLAAAQGTTGVVSADERSRALAAAFPQSPALQLEWGDAALARGDGETARVAYERALVARPGDVRALVGLGLALAHLERPAEARERFAEAARRAPESAEPKLNEGVALLVLGRPAEAESQFRAAAALGDESGQAALQLGRLTAARRSWGEAAGWFQLAARAQPQAAGPRLGLADALAATGRPDQALQHYAEAVRLEPQLAEAHYNMGNALAALGQADAARAAFDAAIAARPGFMEARHNRAVILLARGRPAEAEAELRTVLATRPDYVAAWRTLAAALAAQGRHREAQEAAARVAGRT